MIKIEILSPTAIATVEGYRVLEGQLITHEEYATLVVEVGSVTVSIDEKELVTIDAVPTEPLTITPPINPGPTLSDELDILNKVLEPELEPKAETKVEPKVEPKAKSVSAKTTKTT